MMKELNELIQEIVDFGNVIAYTDNPADPDFQNACDLFSQYLDHRFKELKNKLHEVGTDREINWTAKELAKLGDLITPPRRSAGPYIQWTRNLFQHCEKLQRNKLATA